MIMANNVRANVFSVENWFAARQLVYSKYAPSRAHPINQPSRYISRYPECAVFI